MYQAVRYAPFEPRTGSIIRWIWSALIPFFDDTMRKATLNHVTSGTFVFSKTVPVRTENL
jgi:hypothetical protein